MLDHWTLHETAAFVAERVDREVHTAELAGDKLGLAWAEESRAFVAQLRRDLDERPWAGEVGRYLERTARWLRDHPSSGR